MSKNNFTLKNRSFIYFVLLSCLIFLAGFTDNIPAKPTRNNQPVLNNVPSPQSQAILLFGPTDDRDGDGVLDGIDVDDDNDGIIDLLECPNGLDPFGDDNSNSVLNYQDNTMLDWVDANLDGINDVYDMDRDGIINTYDHDMDGDGIPDVQEANLTDIDRNAVVDGAILPNGLSSTVSIGFTPPDFDGDLKPDFRDIDADADGITDNVEAQFTNYYVLPSGLDTDLDGIDDSYDQTNNLFVLYQGLVAVNFQGAVDVQPDYVDIDSDDDGRSDLIEGHDANLDGVADFLPTGADVDGDGLDDGFDLDLTGANVKCIGMNQIPSPPFFDSNPPANPLGISGCRGPLQRTLPTDLDRTWRSFDAGLLPLTLVRFTAERQDGRILLNWQSENESNSREFVLERSKDGVGFTAVATIPAKGGLQALYSYTDESGTQTIGKLYYRLKQIDNNSRFVYSRILTVSPDKILGIAMKLSPNPAGSNVTLNIASDKKRNITINVFDNLGRLLIIQRTGIGSGDNILPLTRANTLRTGTYTVMITDDEQRLSEKLLIQK